MRQSCQCIQGVITKCGEVVDRNRIKRFVHTCSNQKRQSGRQDADGQKAEVDLEPNEERSQITTNCIAQRSKNQNCDRNRHNKCNKGNKNNFQNFRYNTICKTFDYTATQGTKNCRKYLCCIIDAFDSKAKQCGTSFRTDQGGHIG